MRQLGASEWTMFPETADMTGALSTVRYRSSNDGIR